MSQYTYAGTDVLLYDPLPANLAATRASLLALGFLRITTCASIIALTNALVRNPSHLVICDCKHEDGWLFEFIQNLRQANTIHNPFLPIILISWDKSEGLINTAVDSGADDFLIRPLSTDMLQQRIAAIVERRKSFVVSSGYVGPDRRFGRTSSSSGLFCPPNVLKYVAERGSTDGRGSMLLDRDVAEARTRLHLAKLRSDALRFGTYVRQWQKAEAYGWRRSDCFARMQDLASSMRARSEQLQDVRLVKNCGRLLASLNGLADGKAKQAQGLEKAAGDLYVLLTTDSSLERFRREVEAYLECLIAARPPLVVPV